MNNIYKNITDWLIEGYLPFYSNWLYFNATPYITGTISANTIGGTRIISKDILGNEKRQLTLGIDFVTEYDGQGTSDLNIEMLDEVENFSNWIEIKNSEKDFPFLTDKEKVTDIEVLTSVPELLVDASQSLGKYQVQVRFNYNREREVI